MQSHEDDQHWNKTRRSFFDTLKSRAEKCMESGAAEITAGAPDEPVLDQWEDGDLTLVQRPNDPQGILRVSVGGDSAILKVDYCVFRGDRIRCAWLLEQAAKALRERGVVKRKKVRP